MQAAMTRPIDPGHIAYAGTPNEMWWSDAAGAWVPANAKAPNLDNLVQCYDAIRAARAAKKLAFDKADAELEADQQKLRAVMLAIMNATGAKSIATEHGTAYRSFKSKVSAADWGAVYSWVVADPTRFEIFEKRLKSSFVLEHMEQNDGAIPPGVNLHQEYEVSVRKPTSKPSTSTPD